MVDIKYRQTIIVKYFEVNLYHSCKFNFNSRLGEKTLRENGKQMIGLSFRPIREWEVSNWGGGEEGRGRQVEIFAIINDT